MSILQSAFKNAMQLWQTKSPDGEPKQGVPVYDHFKNLENIVRTEAILQGGGGLIVTASVGKGHWAEIPWIGMRYKDLATNFQEGIYLVYLLSPDFNMLYLTVIQGVTKHTADELNKMTPFLRNEIKKPEGFIVGMQGKLALNARVNSNPDKYERGVLYSKCYDINALPLDEELKKDLKAAIQVYKEYYNKFS
ncbi:MAG: MrcB family domain-containing protein [Candidatus Bathyarchaeia archaeon]|jgi:hypothetical protein